MSEMIDKFDGGLGLIDLDILLILYRKEKKSLESREKYENYLKENFPEDYNNFLKYKNMVEERTPNLKEIYFDWLDGKIEELDFSLFSCKVV
jgi:hypothetical protein